MKRLIIVLLAVLSIASAQNILCSTFDKLKNGKVCSNDVEPVCAIRQSNLQGSKPLRADFNNLCQACQDSSVLFVAQGPCVAYPEDGTFCNPQSAQNKICTMEMNPVCGLVGTIYTLCRGGSCVQTFSNGCNACASGSFFYTQGKCQGQSISQ